MATFFCKLIAPRATFAFDMTDEERSLMEGHRIYWTRAVDDGRVVAFGMVGDPAAPFGIGIVEVEDEPAAQRFTNGDPVILANRGFRWDVLPMPFGVIHR